MSSGSPTKNSILVDAVLPYTFSLLLLAVLGFLLSPPRLELKDVPEFYFAGYMLKAGTPMLVYKPELTEQLRTQLFPGTGVAPLFMPPYGLPLLAPFGALIPVEFADKFWFVFLILCSLSSLILLRHTLKLDSKYVMRMACLLCLSGPEWEAIRHGQIASILLLSLTTSLFLIEKNGKPNAASSRKSDFLTAIAMAPLLAKPQCIVPIVVFLFGVGKFGLLASLVAVMVALAAVAAVLYGPGIFSAYFELIKHPQAQMTAWQVPEVTATIRGQLLRLLPNSDSLVLGISVATFIIAMVFVFLLARKYKSNQSWWEAMALGAIPVGLLTSLHCHNYDLLLLVPSAAVFMLGRLTRQIPVKNKLLWLCTLIPLMMPVYNKIHYEYLLMGGQINVVVIDLLLISVASLAHLFKRHTAEVA